MNFEKDVYFFYYSETDEMNYCLKEGSCEVLELTRIEKSQTNAKFFEVNSNYEAKPESLFMYEKEFNRCANEIKKYTKNRTDYKKWLNDGMSIVSYYKSKATNALKELNIDNVNVDEIILSEKCNNGGMIYLEDELKNEIIDCYGYDFTNCYGTFLSQPNISKLMIPTKNGKWSDITIDILNADKLPYGFYTVKMSTENETIKKYFNFASDDVYVHYSLIQLQVIIQYLMKKNKKLKVESLITITATRCYTYNEKDLVSCDKVFGAWFKDVNLMKRDLKNNFLVKNLSTKLWGYLSQFNRTFVDEDEIEEYDYAHSRRFTESRKFEYLCIKMQNPTKEDSKYELVNVNDPYKHGGIARIKSFLIASVRLYMTRIILDNNIDNNVVRLCTDGIVLNKPFDFKKNILYQYVPTLEDKTTGLIKWYHVNKYNHCCDECGKEWKFNKQYCHKC